MWKFHHQAQVKSHYPNFSRNLNITIQTLIEKMDKALCYSVTILKSRDSGNGLPSGKCDNPCPRGAQALFRPEA